MNIGIPRETHDDEKRVAATPESVKTLIRLGYDVSVESGAGEAAGFVDGAYEAAGAALTDAEAVWTASDMVLKVRPPALAEAEQMKEGAALVAFVQPAVNPELVELLKTRRITALAMDQVPRITRAQKLDALSSMANIAGYRAVVEAAGAFGRFFTGQVTAAGKVPPATVLVIGAGVAGLSAIGTAGGLGAVVRAFDTRPEVKEQVESMGASFLLLDVAEEGSGTGGYAKEMSKAFIEAEMALFAEQAKEVDIIVTTAMIPGKKAPVLITKEMVASMKPGSVIVDLAAEQGGNCELTEPGAAVVKEGVTLIGYTDMVSRLANQASRLYATNLTHLLDNLTPDKGGEAAFDMEDEVVRGMMVTKDGEVTWPPPAPKASGPAPQAPTPEPEAPAPEPNAMKKAWRRWWPQVMPFVLLAAGGFFLYEMGTVVPQAFLQHMTVFVLACFVGYMVIWNVTPSLHTPLMSVTNAISGIIVIGALLQISGPFFSLKTWLAAFAVLIATINVFGGFFVTQRMLKMFRKGGDNE
ncbi:Re/Si-specific NAD(P)(+) transhydrogenase subunit alpha [Desulfoluna butyratoxydans]|uniref:NAD(P) transhydrogenase subunit alpha n=1 Tax=Desulfoluna butyratoxydans TaxID=231438 RepID=A0A4U8YPM9_9BACT|nr:Re/Si-specific NAD(P)(+) transhydrogenase subunit alpha [Desulfoluna butyratoxydans]VFQ45664.1 nad(p) transhydrogenase alpha subunit [Desulfoluna butyratoxydans]